MKTIEKLHDSISESYDYGVIANNLFNNCTPIELIDILKLLINDYDNQRYILNRFFQSSSDACFLEASDMEKLENDFESFVIKQRYKHEPAI